MAHAASLNPGFVREHATVLAVSGAVHVAVLVLLLLNLDLWSRPAPPPVGLAIQAVVVDAGALRAEQARRQARQEEQVRARQAEQEARDEERRREAQREADQRQRSDQAHRAEAEQQRARAAQQRAAAEAVQKQATAERQKQATAERQKQAAEAAQRQAAAEDSRRKADSDRRAAQAKAEHERELAEEERRNTAAQAGLLDRYADQIRQKVERNWIRPAGTGAGLHCVVSVKQIPGGEVVDVRVGECNGDAAVVRSIEAAVLRSSPLPPPPDPALFERSLRFDFKPQE